MKNNVKITFRKDAKEIIQQIALDNINKNGLDLNCPECGKKIHISFSGDACKFCGLVIRFGADPNA